MTFNSHAQPNGKLQVFVNASKCSVLLEEDASKSLTHLSHNTNLQKDSTIPKERIVPITP